MTFKEFIHGTAFKCVSTLLAILLVSGVFLTIMSSLLKVSDEEKTARGLQNVYGQAVTVTETKTASYSSDSATVTTHHIVKIGNETDYLVLSKGKGGYSGGTVTCWVAVTVNLSEKKVVKIRKVSVAESSGQTLMSNFKQDFFDKFSSNGVEDFYSAKPNHFVSGATMSSTAICNAINGAISYVKETAFGQTTANPFDGFEYTAQISVSNPATKYEVTENNKVKYSLITNGDGEATSFKLEITVNSEKKIESFIIVDNGSTEGDEYNFSTKMFNFTQNCVGWNKDNFLAVLNGSQSAINSSNSQINTGASYSNFLCAYAGLFATANYDRCISGGQAQ